MLHRTLLITVASGALIALGLQAQAAGGGTAAPSQTENPPHIIATPTPAQPKPAPVDSKPGEAQPMPAPVDSKPTTASSAQPEPSDGRKPEPTTTTTPSSTNSGGVHVDPPPPHN